MEDILWEISSELTKIKSTLEGAVIITTVLFFFWQFSNPNQTTLYYRTCQELSAAAENCKHWNYGTDTYWVNKDVQKVMFIGTYGPVPLSDCDVIDAKNWFCNGPMFGVKDGAYSEPIPDTMFVRQSFGFFGYWVSRSLYWLTRTN